MKIRISRRLAAVLVVSACVLGGLVQAQQIVLVPGTIGGVVTIANLPITQINITATPQGSGSSTSFGSSPGVANAQYTMTVSVPESATVNYNVTATTIRTDINRDFIRFNTITTPVSSSTPGVANFVLNEPGFIQPTFTVNGSATISSVSLTGTFSASGVFEQAGTNAAANTNFIFPAIPRNNMSLSGTVSFSNGVQVQLPTQSVNVVANQTTQVAYTVDGSVTGSIGGTIQLEGPLPVTRLDINTSGPTFRSIVQQPPPANNAYSLGPLAPGTYSVTTTARFNNNFDDAFSFPNAAYSPSRSGLTVTASETNVNVFAQQSFLNGSVELTGGSGLLPFLNSASVNLSGTSAATSGGSSSDQMNLTTRAFDLIASAGNWRFSSVFMNFFRPAPSLSGNFSYFDNRPTNAITLNAFETHVLDIPIELGEVTLTISVAGGALFSNPSVSGSCQQRDQQNILLWSSSFNFSTSGQNNVQQGTVSFVTPAGQCTFTPRVVINGQTVSLPNTTLGVVAGSSQTVDVGGPTLTNIVPAPEAIVASSSISVSGRASDDVAVASVTVNGIATSLSSANNPSDPAQVNFFTVTAVPLQRGPNTITIVARDVATPQNTTTDTRTVYWDTALPTLNFTPANGFSTFNDTVTVTGTAFDDAGIQRISVNGTDVSFTSTNNPSQPTEVSFSTTVSLVPGSNLITVVVRDISNRTTTQVHTVTRQQQAPTTLTVANASAVYNSIVTLTATLTSQGNPVSGKTIQFTLNGQSVGNVTNVSGVAAVNVSVSGLDVSSYPGAIQASFAGDTNFASSSGTATLTITQANQTITFGALADKTVGDADFVVSATASSGLTVTFAAASGPCTVNGNTVHISGAGTCTIRASQAGNVNYNAAPNVDRPFTINKADQTITFGALANKTFGDADFVLSATASSGLTVTFAAASGPCTVNGNTVHITGAGTCTIRASQGGEANYNAAQNVDRPLTINKADQTITFGALANKAFNDADFGVSATASSGLAVSFAAASGPCTVNGNTVHITGAGTCTIRASQAGDANYNPAPNVDQPFTINKADQTITFAALANKTFGDADFMVNGTASSALAVSFAAASGSCTVAGNTVHITGAGACTIRASQSGNGDYNAAPDVDRPLTIAKANQLIAIATPAPASAIYNTSFLTAATGGGSGNPVAITAAGACVVSAGGAGSATIQMMSGTGTCALYYNQVGDANFNPAPQATGATAAQKAAQLIVVTTSAPQAAVFGASFTVAATGGASGNLVTYSSPVSDGCSNAGSTFTITSGVAPCQVQYNQAGNANYEAATQFVQMVNTVGYAFEGFFAPIDMQTSATPVWNAANAGQAVPVKWRLTLNGLPVASGSSFVGLFSYEVSCSSGAGAIEDAIEEYAPGASGLMYDGDGRFHFNWKTATNYKGKCRAMYVSFADGSVSPIGSFKFR